MTPPAQMRYQVYNYKGPTTDPWSALRIQSWARLLWSAFATLQSSRVSLNTLSKASIYRETLQGSVVKIF